MNIYSNTLCKIKTTNNLIFHFVFEDSMAYVFMSVAHHQVMVGHTREPSSLTQ